MWIVMSIHKAFKLEANPKNNCKIPHKIRNLKIHFRWIHKSKKNHTDQNLECFLKSFKVLHVYFRKEYLKANSFYFKKLKRKEK